MMAGSSRQQDWQAGCTLRQRPAGTVGERQSVSLLYGMQVQVDIGVWIQPQSIMRDLEIGGLAWPLAWRRAVCRWPRVLRRLA